MSSTNTSKITVLVSRILLGLIFFVFGLNFFFNFIPAGPAPEGKAAAFTGGLFQSGYMFQLIKVIEVLCGVLLLAGRFIPLVLVVLMPISLNIFLFHSILSPGGAPVAISIIIIITQLYLAWSYREVYKPLFVAKPAL